MDKNANFAIVGMACRFPGAKNYNQYWENLIQGKNAISEIPKDRWDWQAYYGDPGMDANKTNIKWGGFIEDIDQFDPLFFNISPKEAAYIDPQHRLFLQTAWHCIEDAGYSIDCLAGKKIGVYAGVSKNDYTELMRESRQDIAPFISTGTVHSILANRLSFLFDFHGRSEAIDTACSSSLVALHNAMRDIINGECESALVGGVNALLAPTMFISHSKSGMLSVDGQCKTFDAGANGYVRGEGVGVLYIKLLKDALDTGDHIHAIIKSSAVNHGGRANFLTSPTVEAQARVICSALEKASLDPASISYIEAHGTGTPMGDPIEINALKKAFNTMQGRFQKTPKKSSAYCALSAVKTNIGHLESASGIAGIIKAILAMQHQKIPALQNFNKPNEYIDLEQSPFFLADKNIDWKARYYDNGEPIPRRVGVSSFGMGGVNAHVILEEAPALKNGAFGNEKNDPQLIMMSSKKAEGLKTQVEQLRDYLVGLDNKKDGSAPALEDIAYTLQIGRVAFAERLAFLATSRYDLIVKLSNYIDGKQQQTDRFQGSVIVKKGEKPLQINVSKPADLKELAEQWIQGWQLNWTSYYANDHKPSRVPLPVYAFAKKRCWFRQETDQPAKIDDKPATGLTRSSAVNGAESVFKKNLRPGDFFIKDHRVQNETLLPGVAYLEFARASQSLITTNSVVNTLKNVYWVSPLIVKDQDITIDIKLSPGSAGPSQLQEFNHFQILKEGSLHSKGELGYSDLREVTPIPIDIPAIKRRCRGYILQCGLYQLFIPNGLNYGPSFQSLQKCYYSDHEIFSEISIPKIIEEGFDDFVLHPSIMDGVFQTIVALSLLGSGRHDKQYVPFYLERIEIFKPIPKRCFAHASVRHNAGQRNNDEIKFDAVICDDEGTILVKIIGLTKRSINLQPGKKKPQINTESRQISLPKNDRNVLFYHSEWQSADLQEKPGAVDQLIIFGQDTSLLQKGSAVSAVNGSVFLVTPGAGYQLVGKNHVQVDPANPDDYVKMVQYLKQQEGNIKNILYLWNFDVGLQASADPLELGVTAILRLIKAILANRAYKQLKLIYCHFIDEMGSSPYHSLIGGFARTLAYENPNLCCVSLGVDRGDNDVIVRMAIKEFISGTNSKLHEISYRADNRFVRNMINFETQALFLKKRSSLIRNNGVYLITGGAGGLGFIFARHLSEKYHATVLLLGRSNINPQIQDKIAAIESYGGKCKYFSADITRSDAVEKVFSEIKKSHASLQGVIHAAGIIEDAYILLKKEDSFSRVINTKVKGLENLDFATRDEKLDFFCMFSSIAALMPNQGQSDYAAANSFLDSYASYRNRLRDQKKRYGVSLSINWPLWAQGGMQVTAEEQAHLLHEFGMQPLAEETGIVIFEQGLQMAQYCSELNMIGHIVAIDGDEEKIAKCLGIDLQQNEVAAKVSAEVVSKQGVTVKDNIRNNIESQIKKLFSNQFNLAAEAIDGDLKISQLGLDSSAMMAIIRQLNDSNEITLKPTVFFEIDTFDQFVQHVCQHYRDKHSLGPARYNRTLIDIDQSYPADRRFQRTFHVSEFYLRDHVVEGQFNIPGACYIEMARQAGDLVFGDKSIIKLTNNYWAKQLSSPDKDFTAYIAIFSRASGYDYEITSLDDDQQKIIHAIGAMTCREDAGLTAEHHYFDLESVRNRCTVVQYPDEVYQQIIAEGLLVGSTFKPMQQILLNKGEALATLALPASIRNTLDDYVLHPTMLTGVFQTALVSNRYNEANQSAHFIPMGIDELNIFAPVTDRCFIYSKAKKNNADLKKFDLLVCNEDGRIAVSLKGFAIRALKQGIGQEARQQQRLVQSMTTANTDARDLLASTQQYIKNLLAGYVGLSADEIDQYEAFEAYGINSIMIVELNKAFEGAFGSLSKTLFFEYRNIHELAEYFIENHADKLRQLTGTSSVISNHQQQFSESVHQTVSANTVSVNRVEETPLIPGLAVQQQIRAEVISVDQLKLKQAAHYYIMKLLTSHVGLTIDEMHSSEAFEVYGINSVMIVELNKRFEDDFGSLSKTLFFEYRNAEELADYFIENHVEKLIEVLGITNQKATLSQQPLLLDNGTRKSMPADDNVLNRPASDLLKEKKVVEPEPNLSSHRTDDIAIIGVAGRYPGADTVDEFWDMLKRGIDCVTDMPATRFDVRPLFDADPEQNKIYSKRGAFIEDIDKFDAAFFNISPREAELIDPQERLFLEIAWSTIEDAGYTRQSLLDTSDRQVGVFVGALWQPYQAIGAEETLKGNVIAPSGLLYSIANRVSYFMNFSGPSLAIDTACSSSLTAVHIACQSLRSGDCKLAIAGGVNLSLHSSKYLFLSQNRFLSTEGLCRSFGDGGDGYVPGEGVGAILLKPLSEAIKDGDSIYAVIKGSSVNHGGKTNGYTVPCPKAQAALIRQVYEKSGINPRTISYIEAHGTGTPLGDPIEITGLQKAFERHTQDKQFCAIGSVKSNIGHLEAAAGIASITKVILQMKKRQLVPSIHSDTLNSNIDFDKTPFRVQRELSEWHLPQVTMNGVSKEYPRRAGVSSFGAGGSNAHILLEEFEPDTFDKMAVKTDEKVMVILSAKNDERLVKMVENLLAFLERNLVTGSLTDLAYTLQVSREAMDERLAILVDSFDDLKGKLRAYLIKEKVIANVYFGNLKNHKDLRAIFANDDELANVIQSWVTKAKYHKLLELWVKGFNIDWYALYAEKKARRISLPTYPFARDRYWLPLEIDQKSKGLKIEVSQLHPLVHQNNSSLAVQRFNSLFNGAEFFLNDHIVGYHKILPAVAYIEMFRAVASLSSDEFEPFKLSNLTWLKPILVAGNPEKVIVELAVDEGEFLLQAGMEINGDFTVHAQGQCCYLDHEAAYSDFSADQRLQIEDIRQRLANHAQPAAIYRLFHEKGLNLQAGFQGLDWIKWNDSEAVGQVTLPKFLSTLNRDAYGLHPSLLDSALQTALYVLESSHKSDGTLYLPFSIDEVAIYASLPDRLYSHVQPSDKKVMADSSQPVRSFDVTLVDSNDKILVKVKNISFRQTNLSAGTIQKLVVTEQPAALSYSSPAWIELESPLTDWNGLHATGMILIVNNEMLLEHFDAKLALIKKEMPVLAVLVTDGQRHQNTGNLYIDPNDPDSFSQIAETLDINKLAPSHILYLWDATGQQNSHDLAEQTQQALMLLFQINKMLLQATRPARQLFVNICQQEKSHRVLEGAITGFLNSIAAEYPKCTSKVVSTTAQASAVNSWQDSTLNELLAVEEAQTSWVRFASNGSRRLTCQLQALADIEKNRSAYLDYSAIKQGGTYLISGGMGGVAKNLASYLAKNYSANLILLGRSPLPDNGEVFLTSLKTYGSEAVYLPVDICDLDNLTRHIGHAKKQLGIINGVIHCAGVLEDNLLANKNLESFQRVLQSKLKGTINLDLLTQDDPLDFFAVFSSLTSVLGNPGQCDYGAANGFMDSYMAYRKSLTDQQVRQGLSLSVNWPFWQDGQMGQNQQGLELLDESFGLPLTSAEGFSCFEELLHLGKAQVAIVKQIQSVSADEVIKSIDIIDSKTVMAETISHRDSGDLRSRLWDDIFTVVAELGKFSVGQLSSQIDFMALGFESVVLAKLANLLNKKYSIRVSPALFFEYTNLEKLNAYLLDTYYPEIAALYQRQPPSDPDIRGQNFVIGSQSQNGSSNGKTVPGLGNSRAPLSSEKLEWQVLYDIQNIIAELGKFSVDTLPADSDFISLGLDSVILAKLAKQINKKYGIKLSPAIFFEYTNPNKLQAHLLEAYFSSIAEYYQSGQVPEKPTQNTVKQERNRSSAKLSSMQQLKLGFNPVAAHSQQKEHGQHQDISASGIAVIGMDCQFPGAPDLPSFWELLVNCDSAVSEVPADRWDWQAIYGDPNKEMNKTNIKWGCFVDDLDKFDAAFFNISPREAALMDPQQRLLLQSVWRATEHAGYAPMELSKNFKVGFFAGISGNDYYELLMNGNVEAYSSTGSTHSIAANRVSYYFDFKGPSIAVDTACSSSLVALDMAVKALQNGSCDVAIAGGVNALISPNLFISFSKAGMLSPDGTISPLDNKANGYVRGEGVGILVLKRLDKAIADHDEIHAVIKGTSVNHGGKVASLTVPNPKAQSELVLDACSNANIDISTLNYIEMHGTGTPLGDPIEVNGLISAFKQGSMICRESYCGIASVKGNIGHLEAAAGVAGVIKTVLALKNKTLPGQSNFEALNPHIQLEKTPFRVVEKTQPWQNLTDNNDRPLPRRAGVSSFGFGGANSHAILEEYTAKDATIDSADSVSRSLDGKASLIVLSAKTVDCLKALADQLVSFLVNNANRTLNLDRISYTLQTGRSPMEYRLGVRVTSLEELKIKLQKYLKGETHVDGLYQGQAARRIDHSNTRPEAGMNVISRGQSLEEMLEAWIKGDTVDWPSLYPINTPKRMELPVYPFVKERHWLPVHSHSYKKPSAAAANPSGHLPSINTGNAQPYKTDQTKPEKAKVPDHSTGDISLLLLHDESIRYFRKLASSVLQMPIDRIETSRSLEEYGMDSILVMQVINTLHRYFPDINSTLLLEYRTIDALVVYFITHQRDALIRLVGLENGQDENKMVHTGQRGEPNWRVEHSLNEDAHEKKSTWKERSLFSVDEIAAAVSADEIDFKDAMRMLRQTEMEL